jgi:hypothetical protein
MLCALSRVLPSLLKYCSRTAGVGYTLAHQHQHHHVALCVIQHRLPLGLHICITDVRHDPPAREFMGLTQSDHWGCAKRQEARGCLPSVRYVRFPGLPCVRALHAGPVLVFNDFMWQVCTAISVAWFCYKRWDVDLTPKIYRAAGDGSIRSPVFRSHCSQWKHSYASCTSSQLRTRMHGAA